MKILKFKSYKSWDYPNFDICSDMKYQNKFDFIIADNVWEHLNILIELQKMFTIY